MPDSAASFRNNRVEQELAREVASHLTLLADDFERRGMSPEEARIAAKRAYGGVEQAKQAHRDERSLLWIEQTLQDLRHAGRTLCSQSRIRVCLRRHDRARRGREYHALYGV